MVEIYLNPRVMLSQALKNSSGEGARSRARAMRSVRAACARRARGERAMSEKRASGARRHARKSSERRRARIQESQAGSGRLLGFEELVGAGAIRKQ